MPDAGMGLGAEQPGTRDVPGTQTRLRSLRTRSTIITFSARFLAERSSAASCAAAWPGSPARRAVPLIGLDGDAPAGPAQEQLGRQAGHRAAGHGRGRPRRAARSRSPPGRRRRAGRRRTRPPARRQMLAWKMSPRRMYSTARATAAWCSAAAGISRNGREPVVGAAGRLGRPARPGRRSGARARPRGRSRPQRLEEPLPRGPVAHEHVVVAAEPPGGQPPRRRAAASASPPGAVAQVADPAAAEAGGRPAVGAGSGVRRRRRPAGRGRCATAAGSAATMSPPAGPGAEQRHRMRVVADQPERFRWCELPPQRPSHHQELCSAGHTSRLIAIRGNRVGPADKSPGR